jgi:hypothetical protein
VETAVVALIRPPRSNNVLDEVTAKVPGPKKLALAKDTELAIKLTAATVFIAFRLALETLRVPLPETPVPTKLRLLIGLLDDGTLKVIPK